MCQEFKFQNKYYCNQIKTLFLHHCGYLLSSNTCPLTGLLFIMVTTLRIAEYLTIRPVALSGYGSIAHEAKPNGLLTRGP